MKRLYVSIAILVCLTSSLVADNMLIRGVTVVKPASGEIVAAQDVLIKGDRIVAVGNTNTLGVTLDTITIIDGSDKYLMPGFGEMHGHIPPANQGDQAISDTLFLYLSNGVTTVRGMLGSAGQLALRRKAASGEITAPTLYLAGPSFNGNSVSSPAGAERMVMVQVDEGWDLLKIHPGLSRNEYDATAAKATELGIDFGGHIPADVGLVRAIEVRQRTIDHIDGYMIYLRGDTGPVDPQKLQSAARMTKAAGIGIVPTQALWKTLLGAGDAKQLQGLAELKYVSKAQRGNWRRRLTVFDGAARAARLAVHENRQRLLKAMADEGVEILFGTDAPQLYSVPGFSIHHEIRTMLEAGLTPQQILTSGTTAVGDYFADKDKFGRIAPGNRADLVLLNGNPLENMKNLQNPAGVMHGGHWLSRAAIDKRLKEIAERHQ